MLRSYIKSLPWENLFFKIKYTGCTTFEMVISSTFSSQENKSWLGRLCRAKLVKYTFSRFGIPLASCPWNWWEVGFLALVRTEQMSPEIRESTADLEQVHQHHAQLQRHTPPNRAMLSCVVLMVEYQIAPHCITRACQCLGSRVFVGSRSRSTYNFS